MNRVKIVKSCLQIRIIKKGKKRPGDLSYSVIFLNVTRFVIPLYCCKCVFILSTVSLNMYVKSTTQNRVNFLITTVREQLL